MNAVLSAVVSDLISRFISFLIQTSQTHVAGNHNKISRLQQLLLRADTIVHEAEGRQVTNRAMLLQLRRLREAIYRGYYVLDTSWAWVSGPQGKLVSRCKLQSEIDSLEATLDGMKEFLLVLLHCPPIIRQPYNAYLIMEQCLFGRHVEKERIISFLLHPSSSFDVLPVIGPCYVGKRTLVEHACREDIVKRSFSEILHLRGDDLNNPSSGGVIDSCKKLGPSDGRFLIVVELVRDTDEVAWNQLWRSLSHGSGGSKAILISRIERVSSLGTVQALRLSTLRQEEDWYFFRVLAFGSANPYDHHPDLASIAKEIATVIHGYFTITRAVTTVLRANMNRHFWHRALCYIRKSEQMDIHVFGGDIRDTSRRFCPYFYSFSSDDFLIFCYNRYEVAGSMMQGDMLASAKKAEDILNGKRHVKYGEKFDIITQSPLPPYYYYVTNCVVQKPERIYTRNKRLKRKRMQ